MEKNVIRAVSLPAELERRLLAFASDKRRPISWVAQDALRAYLDGRGAVDADAQQADPPQPRGEVGQ
jgi:predicted transcriptional regulator